MATVTLMTYTGLPQVINKKPTTLYPVLTGTFKTPVGLMNPTVELSGLDALNKITGNTANYMKIEDKYYFIRDWVIRNAELIEVVLHLDVLMTYRAEVNSLTVMLDRSSTSYAEGPLSYSPKLRQYMTDPMMPVTNAEEVQDIEFPFEFSGTEADGTYVLMTAQSGYTPTS